MCSFPYLAVCFRPDMRVEGDAVAIVGAIASRHGRTLQPLTPTRGGGLAALAADAAIVATFSVPQCACDWTRAEHASLEAIARDLLRAREVRRVRIGWWMIGGAVDEGGRSAPTLQPVDIDIFETPDRKAYAYEIARGTAHATTTFARLASND